MKKRHLTPDDDFVGSRLGRELAFLELSPNERLNHMFRERNRLTTWGYFDAKPPGDKRIVFFPPFPDLGEKNSSHNSDE